MPQLQIHSEYLKWLLQTSLLLELVCTVHYIDVCLCVYLLTFPELLYLGLSTNIGSIVDGAVGGLSALLVLTLLAILLIFVVLTGLRKRGKYQHLAFAA